LVAVLRRERRHEEVDREGEREPAEPPREPGLLADREEDDSGSLPGEVAPRHGGEVLVERDLAGARGHLVEPGGVADLVEALDGEAARMAAEVVDERLGEGVRPAIDAARAATHEGRGRGRE